MLFLTSCRLPLFIATELLRGSGWVEGSQVPQDVHVAGEGLMLFIQ
jgi:hypothetical protein